MQTNEEVIRNFYESIANGSQNLADFFNEDVDWTIMDGYPEGGRYVGVKSVLGEFFPKLLSNFKEYQAKPNEFLSVGDRVIVFGRYSGESKLGKRFEVPFCHVYKLLENKISKFNQYTDTRVVQNTL